ncbi:hypothetical protein [Actinopolymorpha sp. B9G3]
MTGYWLHSSGRKLMADVVFIVVTIVAFGAVAAVLRGVTRL